MQRSAGWLLNCALVQDVKKGCREHAESGPSVWHPFLFVTSFISVSECN